MDLARARQAIEIEEKRSKIRSFLDEMDHSEIDQWKLFNSYGYSPDPWYIPVDLLLVIKNYYEQQLSKLTKQIDDL